MLENVIGLLSGHSECLEMVLALLRAIGNNFYNVSWKVLNTKEHSGLPQNRAAPFVFVASCPH